VAVSAFLEGRLGFLQIPVVIERALEAAGRETSVPRSLADVRATDAWARQAAAETTSTLPSS
jgi:1-deoxy-D-xylulose-5-phosphate reductoisomerase